VSCKIQNFLAGGSWRPYQTAKETSFERFESYKDLHYQFRSNGWLMKVHRRFVRHREDSYRAN
jgi:hypothetical protein